MFGFGNSKQKKYKKALEEFLQKMMPVQDYFEIIQARGKGHAQMGEMLGVKASDTDYWDEDHFKEYKSRLSESNDPLAEIELRLKNYSFIKKEMEGFINYAKELEMNLTQGFVDDYYATVATCKSLKMCETYFEKQIQNKKINPTESLREAFKKVKYFYDQHKDLPQAINQAFPVVSKQMEFIDFARSVSNQIKQIVPEYLDNKSSIDKNKNPYGLKEGMIREFILQKLGKTAKTFLWFI
jgi:hypothetical protein